MTFALGLYDLFTYSIPGFLYMSLFGYVAARADWISLDMKDIKDLPSLLLILTIAIGSYLLGHMATPVGRYTDRLFYRAGREHEARRRFASRDKVIGRPYLDHSIFLLQAKAELMNREAALEISRLRAIGLMLRNATAPVLLALVCALFQVAVGGERIFAAVLALIFVLAAWGACSQGMVLRQWANMKTLELCYWDPAIDTSPPSGNTAPNN